MFNEFDVFELVIVIAPLVCLKFNTFSWLLGRRPLCVSEEHPFVDFDAGPWLLDPPYRPPACSTPLILLTTDVFLLNYEFSRLFALGTLVVLPII